MRTLAGGGKLGRRLKWTQKKIGWRRIIRKKRKAEERFRLQSVGLLETSEVCFREKSSILHCWTFKGRINPLSSPETDKSSVVMPTSEIQALTGHNSRMCSTRLCK